MSYHLGIVAPTTGEAAVLLDGLSPESHEVLQEKPFFTCRRPGDVTITLCVCGIGKSNAAHATTLLIEKCNPDFIYMIGVGGAYPSSGLSLGDIVVAAHEIYGDEGLDCNQGFVTMEGLGLPLISSGSFRYYNKIPLTIPSELGGGFRTGPFVTVSSCTGTLRRGMEMERRYPAILCENMEGAAFAHVCFLNRIRAAEVRAISNIIEDRGPGGLDREWIARASSRVQEFLLNTVLPA